MGVGEGAVPSGTSLSPSPHKKSNYAQLPPERTRLMLGRRVKPRTANLKDVERFLNRLQRLIGPKRLIIAHCATSLTHSRKKQRLASPFTWENILRTVRITLGPMPLRH